jgi:NAD(P)-dependent dehydrogenase (short-subunit alcohol dehydrogenase family)
MGKLEGKVAIVTGAGQGLGKAYALAFAKEGAKVAIAELNPKTCEAAAKEIRHLGKESLGVVCNVGDNDQVKKMVKEVVTKFGTVDILVNNAMGYGAAKPVEELDDRDWDVCLQTGLKATWYCCVAVFPYMKYRGGKIINIGSAMGILGLPGTATGAATKEGIRGFTRVAAREWGKYKINMNIICPFAMTPAQNEYFEKYPEEMKRSVAALPLGRIGDPEKDIGRTAVFLASADSDYMTGQTLNVDGGSVML